MFKRILSVWAFSSFFVIPNVLFASVVMNEVFFDPAGIDTGLEKIEIYNPDVGPVAMGGWELYPDGIGYFVFSPGFSLGAKSFLTVHLRLSGTDDALHLYHPTPTTNMGNSSGSVALFKPGGRSPETIVDFLRYHKPGSSERKTWESTAGEAGLWAVGEFIDISSLVEGNSIGLVQDGLRSNAASWKIYSVSSIGSANVPPGAPPPTPSATTTPASPPASGGSGAVRPALRADAGEDATAIAGAIMQFRGLAYGFDGEPIPTARFLWNFGDGVVGEGKALTHVYHFPGIYHASLTISSGEYTGSDWRLVRVLPPAITISEVKPGAFGFVELFNGSDALIDVGGMSIADERANVFRIPVLTLMGRASAVAFPAVITGLRPESALTLRDARAMTIDAIHFRGVIPPEASWERIGSELIVETKPTPGMFSPERPTPPPNFSPPPPSPSQAPTGSADASILREGLVPQQTVFGGPAKEEKSTDRRAAPLSPLNLPLGQELAFAGFSPTGFFLAASIIVSFLFACVLFLVKRKFW